MIDPGHPRLSIVRQWELAIILAGYVIDDVAGAGQRRATRRCPN